MKRQQGQAGPEERVFGPHHIDAVAHHFLSRDDGPSAGLVAGPVAATCRDIAVAAPGSGRAAACAAAGLAALAGTGWRSCLIEDATVAWSAFSYLGGPDLGELPAAVAADLPPGLRARWLTGDGDSTPGPPVWLRWRHLGEASAATLPVWEIAAGLPAAARAALPRWAALVWCVDEAEAAAPASVACLLRVLALLRPARLEFLVVPEAWAARPGVRRPGARPSAAGGRNPLHLQEIVRKVGGSVAVQVHVFPELAGAAGGAGSAVLGEIAAALANMARDSGPD